MKPVRNRPRLTLWLPIAALALLGIGLPLAAQAVSPQPTNISGAYTLTSSPVTATVDATAAPDAVFAVSLNAGDQLSAAVNGPAGTDFKLRVYQPTATSVSQSQYIVASSGETPYPKLVTHSVPSGGPSGTHFVNVHSQSGAGEAQLLWSIKRATSITLATNRSTVAYKGSAVLAANLMDSLGQSKANEAIALHRSYDNANWTHFATLRTGVGGSGAVSVSPVRKTYYRAVFPGGTTLMGSGYSASVTVAPQVSLGRPTAPTKMTCNKPYGISGTLKPRLKAGSRLVSVRAYHSENGSWVLKNTFAATARDYKSYSQYRGRATLNAPGKWQLRAYVPNGSIYAESLGSAKVVTVPKQKASRVSAWVSDSSPDKYDHVTASAKVKDRYGKVIKGAKVVFTWRYKTSTQRETAYSDSTGVASCERWISSAKSGYRVRIGVKATSGGGTAKTSTGFTPN